MRPEKENSSFVKGAVILAASNILIKIIGAVFRIPLTNLVGSYGMGLYSAAYRYYTILLTIATAGLPIAISKMVAESRALGRVRDSERVFKVALLTCFILGVGGAAVLAGGSRVLAAAVNDLNAAPGILALSPAVLFISAAAAYRGYFQGRGDMLPTALSQITEAVSRLVFGLALAFLLIRVGAEERFVAAGAISGVTVGCFLAALLLFLFSFRRKRERPEGPVRPRGEIFRALMSVAVPVTFGALIMNLTGVIDLFFVTNSLAALGYASEETTSLYGIYDNYAVPLFNLVPSVIIALNASVTPVIAASFARGDRETLRETLKSALRIITILTLPAAAVFLTLSEPILNLLFHNAGDTALAAPVLSLLAPGVFFLCASSFSSTAMQALGRARIPVYTMLAGALVKVLANSLLIPIRGVELNGAAVGTTLCYATITVLNFYALKKVSGFYAGAGVFLRPVLSAGVSGVVMLFSFKAASMFFSSKIALVLAGGAGALVYFAVLFAIGGITKKDFARIPGLRGRR